MSVNKKCDGLKQEMDERWIDNPKEFPLSGTNYVENYNNIEDHLNQKYHVFVGLGASLAGDGVLTDHGVRHIQNVIDKSWRLIHHKIEELTGYELYILLLAIHFHDLGNISGRNNHEQKIIDVMNEVKNYLSLDVAEQDVVSYIALAHSGHVQNNEKDKNTLGALEHETTCNGIKIRPILLAAILRFADELADDYYRAIPNVEIPPANQIYHEYSKSLEPIGFNGKTLIFRYRIPYDFTQITFMKEGTDVFLYDEILVRIMKCLRELDYCSRYAKGYIDIETISVDIQVRDKENINKLLLKDSFQLSLAGYPREEAFRLDDFIITKDASDQTSKIPKYSNGEELKIEARKLKMEARKPGEEKI